MGGAACILDLIVWMGEKGGGKFSCSLFFFASEPKTSVHYYSVGYTYLLGGLCRLPPPPLTNFDGVMHTCEVGGGGWGEVDNEGREFWWCMMMMMDIFYLFI